VFLKRRFGAKPSATPALAGVGGAGMGGGAQVAWPQNTERQSFDNAPAASGSASGAASGAPFTPAADQGFTLAADAVAAAPARTVAKAFVPAAFDSENFTRTAKMIFIRLQAANDTADLDDLRRFTTPELFASLRLDIQDRGPSAQHTDVQKVDAEVLDVSNEDGQQVVSVRFTGHVVEEKGAAPTAFNEVWHLVKPLDDSRSWAIAGIEQVQ
jgi:predicted lipid-binding transport protein (Tim44 family)